jgi:hypothetical protein
MKTLSHDDQAKAGVEQGELFEFQFAARCPNPGTQAAIALASLLRGEYLRQVDWLHVGWRLAAAIGELRDLGWPVLSILIHINGRKRPIAEYSLPGWGKSPGKSQGLSRELQGTLYYE